MNAPSSVLILKDDYPLEDWGRAARFGATVESHHEKSASARTPICGCFISHKGHAEPGAVPGFPGPNPLSEEEALTQLQRCLAETGQLVVRSADHLTDVWFVGVGDPESLFVEFFPRGRTAPAEGCQRYWMCQLGCAERLLKLIYRGASYAELYLAMPAHAAARGLALPTYDKLPQADSR